MDSLASRPSEKPLSDVSPLLWLGLPLLSLAIVLLTPLMGYAAWDKYFMMGANWHTKEFGFLEVVPLFFLATAVVLAILLFRRRRQLPARVGTVMLLVGVAAFYFMGEESSWGQHYLGYNTPDGMVDLNRQGEFNLHNNRGPWKTVFSTIPRTTATVVLSIAAVLPLLLRKHRGAQRVAGPWYWLLPTPAMSLIFAMAALSTVPGTILRHYLHLNYAKDTYVNMAFQKPSGEFKEYLIALAMLVYVASVFARLRCQVRRRASREKASPTGAE
jgi:hypothetical protein